MMITEQINKILEMPEGWLEYKDHKLGKKYNSNELDWLQKKLAQYETVIQPKIYPVEPNDINVEWNGKNYGFVLEITMKERTGFFYWEDFNTREVFEKELNLNTDENWKYISSIINMHQ